jgi:hypothetical protein
MGIALRERDDIARLELHDLAGAAEKRRETFTLHDDVIFDDMIDARHDPGSDNASRGRFRRPRRAGVNVEEDGALEAYRAEDF